MIVQPLQGAVARAAIRHLLVVVATSGLCWACAMSGAPELARSLELSRRATDLFAAGRYQEARDSAAEDLTIRERVLGPEDALVAAALNNLAITDRALGRYAEAEASFRRSLAIHEAAGGPAAPALAAPLTNLADLEVATGRYAEAETLYRRAIAIQEASLDPAHPELVISLNKLGLLYVLEARFADAEALYARSLAAIERAGGAVSPRLAASLANLAALRVDQGRLAEAEPLLTRAASVLEAAHGREHPDVATAVENLAVLKLQRGQLAEAETLLRRALATRESLLGPEHPIVAKSLGNLAELYGEEARDAEAAPLYRRSLAIREAALGPHHPDVALALNNLAGFHLRAGRFGEAEALLARSLEIREALHGAGHPDVALALNNLGAAQWQLGREEEATRLFERSLAIREAALGPDHPDLATSLENLALARAAMGRVVEAESIRRRSLAIRESALGTDHPLVAASHDGLAQFYAIHGRRSEAVAASRRAVAILGRRTLADPDADAPGSIGAQRGRRPVFLRNVATVHAAGGADVTPETFRAGQIARSAGTGRTVAGMAARFAAGTDGLAAIVRQRQDLGTRLQRIDAALIRAVGRRPDARDPAAEAALRREAEALRRDAAILDTRIASEFPTYTELMTPQPVELAAVQQDLATDEALLVFLVGDDASWLWAVRRQRAALFKLATGVQALAADVAALRRRLDPESNPDLRPFDTARAHALYETLLRPAAAFLAGARHLVVVPDGPLESLPLGVLVTRQPSTAPASAADHRHVAWLARDHAVTVLPTVGSLHALRRVAAGSRGGAPFAGIGDPTLRGTGGTARGTALARLFRGTTADVDAVRQLPALPETADELRAVARALRASTADLFLGERASEPILRSARLDDYRVLHFATHGLVSGDLKGLAEPALVLTPPSAATSDDDGLLTASEVATLRLDADWVVLSACNTAAGDGTPDGGGLSGLARAFFYAGARSVLVSHWSVPSTATVRLVTGTFEALRAAPGIGRAEALRRSQQAMLSPASPPDYAHPMAWAPFVLAGEGAPGR